MPLPQELKPLFEQRTAYLRDPYYNSSNADYLYLLIEPEENCIRYVGACVKPFQRYSAHVSGSDSSSGVPSRRWIASLKNRGQLPRIYVASRIDRQDKLAADSLGILHCNDLPLGNNLVATLAEQALIRRVSSGMRIGGGNFTADLLNVVHKSRKKICR